MGRSLATSLLVVVALLAACEDDERTEVSDESPNPAPAMCPLKPPVQGESCAPIDERPPPHTCLYVGLLCFTAICEADADGKPTWRTVDCPPVGGAGGMGGADGDAGASVGGAGGAG